jgi:C-terminal processing protease CtpA/Prc
MMKEEPEMNLGPSISHKMDDKERYSKARDEAYPDGIPGYEEFGNTAYITFDEFVISDADYYAEDKPEDTVGLMIRAFEQITREGSPIENVVLDLSNNGGGMADAAAYVIGMFLGDGSICMMNPLSGALVSQNFRIDANLDREFDEKDNLRDYNLFCLTSPRSFSCGNLVPSVFKSSNRVTILGQTSGGGACVVQNLTTADGCPFSISGLKRLAYMKNGSFYDIDQGVDPDFVIPKADLFYDRQYLTKYINGLLGK